MGYAGGGGEECHKCHKFLHSTNTGEDNIEQGWNDGE